MPEKALFVATGNPGKVREVHDILGLVLPEWRVYSLQDFPDWERPVDECGASYHDNAYLKALAYLDNPLGLPTIADDSGLEVLAFPGLLGVHSARWCAGSMETKVQALFDKLQGVEDRRMVFHTTFCYLAPSRAPVFFDSDLPGRAAEELGGQDGFDYDPIFIPDGYNQTYGELGHEVKNRISQRRRALEQLAAYLRARDESQESEAA